MTRKVKRALISVSDKSGIEDFAKGLHALGIEILSTGGTAKLIKKIGIPVRSVSDYTGFPEMLDGRVKTLHPRIHAALLALRDNPGHMKQVDEQNIELIDMVVVNLYPFEKTLLKNGVSMEEAIENIDIGGPSMLRSAAKNFRSVAVISNPRRYDEILKELKENKCFLNDQTQMSLAGEVFELTSNYDKAICDYLKSQIQTICTSKCPDARVQRFPEVLELKFKKVQELRYGENPHQQAAFYKDIGKTGLSLASVEQLHGKELSFNNIIDLSSALDIVREFAEPAAVVIKHTNPCGAAAGKSLSLAYRQALACDPLSAFGSIIGLNRVVDRNTAEDIFSAGFMECIIAPGYEEDALEILKEKKNLRLLRLPDFKDKRDGDDFKMVIGAMLLQDKDTKDIAPSELKVVTRVKPNKQQTESLLFGWKITKHVRSNAIVLSQGKKTVGIGAGQMSRVDAVIIAARKAGVRADGSALASDAFFPQADGIEMAAACGAKAIIQPGGSIRDDQVIKAADKAGIAMVFTGMRHFKH